MKKSTIQSKRQETVPARIKVKLDYRTTIIINKLSSLKIWKKRYPLAEVIN